MCSYYNTNIYKMMSTSDHKYHQQPSIVITFIRIKKQQSFLFNANIHLMDMNFQVWNCQLATLFKLIKGLKLCGSKVKAN
jgi:hypothetical protein